MGSAVSALITLTCVQFAVAYIRSQCSTTQLFYKATPDNVALVSKLRVVKKYSPTFWLNGGVFPALSGWLHTVFTSLFRRHPRDFGEYQRKMQCYLGCYDYLVIHRFGRAGELLSVSHGGTVALDWRGMKAGHPTLIILHGLTGGSDEA